MGGGNLAHGILSVFCSLVKAHDVHAARVLLEDALHHLMCGMGKGVSDIGWIYEWFDHHLMYDEGRVRVRPPREWYDGYDVHYRATTIDNGADHGVGYIRASEEAGPGV